MDYPTIKYLEALSGYRLFVIFDNGIIKIYSLGERLETQPFIALKNEELFRNARISAGGYGVVWNDEVDLSEYELWTNGKSISSIEELSRQTAA